MSKLPYVRNAPLFRVEELQTAEDTRILRGTGGETVVLGATAPYGDIDADAMARRVSLSWNFHDPLVDALKDLVTISVSGEAKTYALSVLEAIKQAQEPRH